MSKLRLILLSLVFAFVSALWAGTPATVSYTTRDGLSSNLIGGGVQERNGLLWFASWNGLNCYDGYDFHWVKIKPGDGASIGTNLIRDIQLLPEGNILCHTDDDIYEFDLRDYTFRDIPPERKDSLRALVGKRWPGLHDIQGSVWTSDHNGLYKTFTPVHPAEVLSGTEGRSVRALMTDRDGHLWVGMRGVDSVAVYDRELKLTGKVSVQSTPYCIYQLSSGEVWIGCKPGALLKAGGESVLDSPVYDLKEDRYGRLWVATFGDGVKCISNPGDSEPRVSQSLGGGKVRKLLITPDDNLIAATSEGLLIGHITPPGESWPTLRAVRRDGKDAESLSSNSTIDLARDSRGNIYVCTGSSGLDVITEESLFSSRPQFRHYNAGNSSLGGDDWNSMMLDSDSLLVMAGSDRVVLFNPLSDSALTLGETFWAERCSFTEATPVKTAAGQFAFGTDVGVLTVGREEIFNREYVPPLVFTTLSVNGGAAEFKLAPLESISLSAESRNVTVGFAAIDFVDNKSILYRVSVDGSPWTDASASRSVTLFNMEPGRHRLEVQSTDRYGRWVENTKRLEILVAPYWYETWWAGLILAVILLALVGGSVYLYLYIKGVNRQRRELLEKYMQLLRDKEVGESAATEAVEECPDEIPAASEGEGMSAADEAFLARVTGYIEANLANPDANIDDMAEAGAVSRSTLNRRLRSLLGVSASQFMTEARLRNALRLLEEQDETTCPVAEVAARSGYSDVYYFQRVFKKRYGTSAAEYRRSRAK